jgi:hypothetical protein
LLTVLLLLPCVRMLVRVLLLLLLMYHRFLQLPQQLRLLLQQQRKLGLRGYYLQHVSWTASRSQDSCQLLQGCCCCSWHRGGSLLPGAAAVGCCCCLQVL